MSFSSKNLTCPAYAKSNFELVSAHILTSQSNRIVYYNYNLSSNALLIIKRFGFRVTPSHHGHRASVSEIIPFHNSLVITSYTISISKPLMTLVIFKLRLFEAFHVIYRLKTMNYHNEEYAIAHCSRSSQIK